jgi:hypothetical protein
MTFSIMAVHMLSVVMLNAIYKPLMLSVIMLNVVMLSVVAPFERRKKKEGRDDYIAEPKLAPAATEKSTFGQKQKYFQNEEIR